MQGSTRSSCRTRTEGAEDGARTKTQRKLMPREGRGPPLAGERPRGAVCVHGSCVNITPPAFVLLSLSAVVQNQPKDL